MVGVHAFQGTRWTVAGEVPGLAGDHHPAIAPYGMFATATAPVQIACGSEGLWRALCTAFGWDPAEDRFATNPQRVANRDELIERIETLFADKPAEHWLALLADAGVPSGKVRSLDDVYGWEQTLSQGLLLSVEHATQGRLDLPGSPIRFDDNSFSGGRPEHVAPPTLGQHDASIRAWLDGLDS
jgi:crotonobetainyl-CoA:carnitine CoA-transferase CaiB-like acyl-CoA transferase